MITGRKPIFWAILLCLPFIVFLIGLHYISYSTIRPINVSYEGDSIIAYDPEMGFVPRPSSRTKTNFAAFSFNTYTDDRSARVTIPGQSSPARIDIATIGCSFTWGHGLENQDTYAAKVASGLNLAGSNFAMGSYSTVQSLQILRRNRDLSPKLVVYGFITDHLRRNVVPCASSIYPFCMDVAHVTWGTNGRPQITLPLTNGVKRFQLQVTAQTKGLDPVTWITHGVDVAFGRLLLNMGISRTPDDTKKDAALTFLLDEMAQTVDAMGATLLVVYIPTDYAPPPPALLRSNVKLKVPFLDLTDAFRHNREITGNSLLYIPGDGHPSVAGHALIAEEIIHAVQEKRLLSMK